MSSCQTQKISIEHLLLKDIESSRQILSRVCPQTVSREQLLEEDCWPEMRTCSSRSMHLRKTLLVVRFPVGGIVVAGGGFDHGGHIRGNAEPLNELFLSLVNNIDGVNVPTFKYTHQKFKHFG